MTYIITNLINLNKLLNSLGKCPEAKLEIGTEISRSTIRDMLKGKVPSPPIRDKVAKFFEVEEGFIWPTQTEEEPAA